jgi:hypothetical protein
MSDLRARSATWMVAATLAAAAPGCRFEPVTGVGPAGDAAVPDTVAIGDASNDWWDDGWQFRRSITIKHTDLTGPVQNFPILVRLPQGVGRPGGEDLRFLVAGQRTPLPHELDTAPLSGALVWVRIPELSNTSPSPVVWVYYGNDQAQTRSSGAQVFAGHVSVHHLGPTGPGPTLPDATGNGHTASAPASSMPSPTTGRIGNARAFDGTNDHLELAGEGAYDFTTSLTVSAWVRVANFGPVYQAIVCKGDKTWRLHRAEAMDFVGFGTTVNNVNDNQVGTTNIANGNAWHHVAIVLGSSTKQIFVDGQLDKSDTVGPTIDVSNFPVLIGRNAEAQTVPDRYWNGDIDEVRISSVARDAHWLFAEHHTVVTADFVQVGVEETRPR